MPIRPVRNYAPQVFALGGLSLFIGLIAALVFLPVFHVFSPSNLAPVSHAFVTQSDASSLQELQTLIETKSLNGQDESIWQSQNLPDDWVLSEKNALQYWYRHSFIIDTLAENTMAVYLPMVSHNAAVYVNGVWVGQGGTFSPSIARNHNRPLLFPFSPSLLRLGDNHIHIRVKAETPLQGLLDKIYLGPQTALAKAHALKTLVRVSLVKWITGVMLVMAFVLACFWGYRRYDSAYGVFSLVLLFWGLHNLNLFIIEAPVLGIHWETVAILTLGWTVSSVIWFDHRYLDKPRPLIEKIMGAHSLMGLLLFFTPDYASLLFWGYKVWYAFLMLFGLYASYFLFSVYLREKSRDAFMMLLVGSVIVVFGVHDILLVNNHWSRFDGFIIQYSAIPTVILFGWFLLRRFLLSLETAENLARTLEDRVRFKQSELEEQYERLYTLEKARVLSQERERMMRDMHDGFGGNLVSLSNMFQKQSGDVFLKAQEKVQNCITDLHLVIDSLDPMLGDLTTLLATMRVRLVSQLENAGVTLEWKVNEIPQAQEFSPQRSLHIMRIIQEAITNSIKHSGSSVITLSTSINPDSRIEISVKDYRNNRCDDHGGGDDGENRLGRGNGHGLKNMRWRAKQVGGNLDIAIDHTGAEVVLSLSLK